jgi:regulator of replication initiation timing
MELNREQVIKDLQEIVDNYSGSWKRFNVLDGALSLIKELTEELEKERTWADSMIDNLRDDIRKLTEENERLKTIPEQLHKEMSERMIEEVKVAKKYTVRRMQSDIQEACLKGGIWPAFVAGVVKGVGEKILENNNVQVTD